MGELTTQDINGNLNAVLERIRESFHPTQVILFGSHASGTAGPESDWDLLVVAPQAPAWKEAYRFRTELASTFRLKLHLLFISEEKFRETKDVVGGLAFPATRTGVTLYEQKP
jgi:predicted nucleotidyltransferase